MIVAIEGVVDVVEVGAAGAAVGYTAVGAAAMVAADVVGTVESGGALAVATDRDEGGVD